ncbi:TraR/DksA C4-type zinc finger protein [Pantoea coffeiphila]|uniref:TraR/DksA C4-type zinc finger protein n=1 Tax=Pantoea coffeiphila TaxID=1465635 RepID=UPI00196042B5|nr:TraR/DksA C4-type zinc finger protein [Pantoea coffeiphila]MBM7341661.1 phage/conjugal plasmid C-4 type zinc finger TraR family protein [Pantoea coffeiphila]
MADVIDIAQEHANATLERQIMAVRSHVTAESAFFCESCGVEIEQLRRIAVPGVSTCHHCQSLIESRAKHFKGGAK